VREVYGQYVWCFLSELPTICHIHTNWRTLPCLLVRVVSVCSALPLRGLHHQFGGAPARCIVGAPRGALNASPRTPVTPDNTEAVHIGGGHSLQEWQRVPTGWRRNDHPGRGRVVSCRVVSCRVRGHRSAKDATPSWHGYLRRLRYLATCRCSVSLLR